VTKRDYTTVAPGVNDSYFIYDNQDRLMCETTVLVSSCPTTGTNIKMSRGTPAFTSAGDWREFLRPVPGSTGLVTSFNPSGYGTSHRITTVRQNDGTPQLGDTILQYNSRGSRVSDDNTSTLSHDARTYSYDDRNNVINVHGQYLTGGSWHTYDVTSAFDTRGRRVLKVFTDTTTSKQAEWLFDYDIIDRLTEIKFTPDTSSSSTYDVFQLIWLQDRIVAYWQTSYPAETTTRRYVASDETGRPFEMWDWPTTGNASRVWAVNPTALGGDLEVLGASIFQPIVFAGQFIDAETAALGDAGTTARPATVQNRFRTYDPFVAAYLEVDPLAPATRSSYVYVHSNPVSNSDPSGLCEPETEDCMVDTPLFPGDFDDLEDAVEDGLCDVGSALFGFECGSSGGANGWGYGTGYGPGWKNDGWGPGDPGSNPEDDTCTGARCPPPIWAGWLSIVKSVASKLFAPVDVKERWVCRANCWKGDRSHSKWIVGLGSSRDEACDDMYNECDAWVAGSRMAPFALSNGPWHELASCSDDRVCFIMPLAEIVKLPSNF
jgi:RHS repeat-associated protein